jgi:RHS repeat-associated protein
MNKTLLRSVSLAACLSIVMTLVPTPALTGAMPDSVQDVPDELEMGGVPEHIIDSVGTRIAMGADKTLASRLSDTEPPPVDVGEPLPSGTVGNVSSFVMDPPHQVFLPLVTSSGGSQSTELALRPEIWMKETSGWNAVEQHGVVVRYPPHWQTEELSGMEDDSSAVQFAGNGQSVQVVVERDAEAGEVVHPDVMTYRRTGYAVREITVKGIGGWEITAGESGAEFCREVIVGIFGMWIRFQMDTSGVCADDDVFRQMMSSLQFVIQNAYGDESETREGISETETDAELTRATNAINAVYYDRIAAYNYAVDWFDVFDNRDGYHYWCNIPEVDPPCDGAHFLAHIMQAGGLPIHWNASPQQDHNNPIVYRINDQRAHVLSTGWAYQDNVGNLENGDIIYYRPYWYASNNYCWGSAVVGRENGEPIVAVHSVLVDGTWHAGAFGLRYDTFKCPAGTPESDMRYNPIKIDTPLKLTTSLELNPSAQQTGDNVTATFTIENSSSQSLDVNVRVRVDGGQPNFAMRSISIPSSGSYTYEEARSFSDSGTFQACAQMNDGTGWQNIPAEGGLPYACRQLDILDPDDIEIQLDSPLVLEPNEVYYPGEDVQATFSVVHANTSGDGFTFEDDFRAYVTAAHLSDPTQFPVVNNVTLNPGDTYDYDKTSHFTDPDIYEVIAQQRVVDSWTALLGDGSELLRVYAPEPDDVENKIGEACYTCGYWGDPTNTATGNYAYDFTDMSDPTPGLSLEVTRWYNAINAPDVEGPFGYGSSWLYGTWIDWRPDKTAVVHMYDGHSVYFVGDINPADYTDMSGVYHNQDLTQISLERFPDDTAVMIDLEDQTTYHFDTNGRLVRIEDDYPSEIVLTYTGDQLTQVAHSVGVVYSISYNAAGYIDQIASSTGRSVSYTYTPSGDLASMTRADGTTYTYNYDGNHRLTAAHDPNGHPYVRNVYNAEGRVIRQYDQTGGEYCFNYGADLTSTRVFTDPLGNTISHTYDDQYRLIHETDEMGYVITRTYDAEGNVLAQRDKNGGIWRYTYDARRNRTSETDPLGNTRHYTYDAHNNMTSFTDAVGNTWRYEYDANDRLTRTIDPLGYTQEYGYDSNGYLIWEEDEVGRVTQYGYDAFGFQTMIVDAGGAVTRMAYDEWGNQTVYTDAIGNHASFIYDELNRLVESIDPLGNHFYLYYDDMGNLITQTNALGDIKTYTYDDHDRIVAETDFMGNPTYTAYDQLGRQTAMTDALGYTTVYTYNARGELVAQRAPDGGVTRRIYDGEGNLLSEIDPLGRVTEYVYDAANRLVEVREPCDTCAGGVAVTQRQYDAAGHVILEIDPRGATTAYAYDALGRQSVITDAYGATRTFTYDPAGRLIQEIDQVGAIMSYEYGLSDQPITTTNALGHQSFTYYDAVGRLVMQVDERGNATTYAYDANDNLVVLMDALGNTTTYTYDAENRRTSTTDPLSRTTTTAYDANGNQVAVTDPRGNIRTAEYDALNRAVRQTDALGNVTEIVYDSMGRAIAQIDPLGNTRTTTYDAAGRRVAEQTPLGFTAVYTYDVADNLVARRNADGAVWLFEYDEVGHQIREIDPLGAVWETEYDLLGRAVVERDPLGFTTRSIYDAAGRLVRQVDPRGMPTSYAYDLLGRRTVMTNALGYTQVYTYDGAGNLITSENERGAVTAYIYDQLNRRVSQIDPLGATSHTVYDAAGQMIATVDYEGYTTQYVYDAAGNQVESIDPFGNPTVTEYDALNRPVAVTDPLGRTTTKVYSPMGQVVRTTTPGGHTTSYHYDADGRRVAYTDAMDNTWHTTHDEVGRAIQETDPLGRVTVTTYDAAGRRIAETDALSRTTHYEYDPLGRLTAVIGSEGTTQYYLYDPAGNLIAEQDGNGHFTYYQFDALNRVHRKIDAVGHVWTYGYDPAGNETDIRTPAGHHVQREYDDLGRLVARWHDGVQVATYAYNANGSRVEMVDETGTTTYVYDALNRLIASTDPDGRTVYHVYDAAGQRTMLVYPDGREAHYAYDADGNLSQVTAPDGDVTTYTYDPLGRQTLVLQGNGVLVTTTYDAVGNVLDITQRDVTGTTFARQQFTIDAVNRRVREVELLPQGTITTDYVYDELNRLVASLADDGRETYYAFDDAGNRTAMWGVRLREGMTETEVYTITYTYNAANQLRAATDNVLGETTYLYDADGNRTGMRGPDERHRYAYDAESHMTAAYVEEREGGVWHYRNGVYQRYVYDGNGRRVVVTMVDATANLTMSQETTLYDATTDWDVLQTYEEAGDEIRDTLFLNDRFLHKLGYWRDDEAGYFQNDGLGSVLGATDQDNGLVVASRMILYSDYGEMIDPEIVLRTDNGFAGYKLDGYTGLNYARNRYYDTGSGVFLTLDSYPQNQNDLFSLLQYIYARSNPINLIDPLGLFPTSIVVSSQMQGNVGNHFTRNVATSPLDDAAAGRSSGYMHSETHRRNVQSGVAGFTCGRKNGNCAGCSGTRVVSLRRIVETKTNILGHEIISTEWVYFSLATYIDECQLQVWLGVGGVAAGGTGLTAGALGLTVALAATPEPVGTKIAAGVLAVIAGALAVMEGVIVAIDGSGGNQGIIIHTKGIYYDTSWTRPYVVAQVAWISSQGW